MLQFPVEQASKVCTCMYLQVTWRLPPVVQMEGITRCIPRTLEVYILCLFCFAVSWSIWHACDGGRKFISRFAPNRSKPSGARRLSCSQLQIWSKVNPY